VFTGSNHFLTSKKFFIHIQCRALLVPTLI